jgi:hypothetical protein
MFESEKKYACTLRGKRNDHTGKWGDRRERAKGGDTLMAKWLSRAERAGGRFRTSWASAMRGEDR